MLFKANLVESFILIFNDMNNIQIFENPEFGQVRVFIEEGKPLFVAKDVAVLLGYSNPAEAILTHCKSGDIEKRYVAHENGFGGTNLQVINESNLYRLIMGSKTSNALKFQDWVVEEVLPSIRKTGSYSVQHKLPQTYKEALIELIAKVEENEKLLIENTELKPKGEFYDAVAGSDTLIDMNQVSKTLNVKGLGRNKLFEFLRSQKILMNDNQPYQQYVDKGYFKLIEVRWTNPKTGDTNITLKTMVFQTGLDFIRKTVKKYYK